MTTWDAEERLKLLTDILDRLSERPEDEVILVEGKRDRGALHLLGVDGEMITVQTRDGIFSVAEQLARERKRAIILTDWDRKGGHLSRLLRSALTANDVPFDEEVRARLGRVVKGDIKDIESLPTFFSRLVRDAGIKDGAGYRP